MDKPAAMFDRLRERLDSAVSGTGFLNGAVCLISPDGPEQSYAVGRVHPHSDAKIDPALRLRVASISKSATARIACELAVRNVLPLDAKVTTLLDWPSPPSLMDGVTVRMLLDHTSGLTDHAGYIFLPPQSPMGYVEANATSIASGHPPGQWFKYANLNYVLLGSVLEAVSGMRFDRLARLYVFEPAGIAGGFNWSGVAPAQRDRHLPVYQRIGGELIRQTEPDTTDWQADIVRGDGRGFGHAEYMPVRDTLLHSPHAGLRMNVIEAARLARLLGDDSAAGHLQRESSWKFDPDAPNGSDCDGLYGEFGLGLMVYRKDPHIPGPLVGHAGHALGFTGGIWHNEATGNSVAIFLTGSADLTEDQDDEAFYAEAELSLMQAL